MLFSCSIAVQFTEQSVYLHTSNSNDITQCLLPTRLIHFSVSYGKIVTSQCRQQLPIFICVGDFMHHVSLIFHNVILIYMAETELRVTQALEKSFTIVIFHIRTVGA